MRGTTFVDEDAERAKAGLLLAAIAAFLISGWFSYNELKYALRGRSVDAAVLRMYEYLPPARHGRPGLRLGIVYQFTDAAGRTREGRDWVPVPSDLQGRELVRVQYLPGADGGSRLAANRSVRGPVIFLVCVALVVVSLVRLVREAHAPIPRARPRRLP